MSSPKRVGVIGAGPWGRVLIRALQRMPERFKIETIVTSNEQAPSWPVVAGGGCSILKSWRDLFAAKDLDAVVIATPPQTHGEILCAAMAAGMPAFVEKPLCLNTDEAADLLRIQQETGALVLVDHIHLFSAAFERLKQELATMGPVLEIESYGGNDGPFRQGYSALWDYGSHDLAMILDLMDDGPEILSCTSVKSGQGENFEVGLTFSAGARCRIRVGSAFETITRRLLIRARDGELVYDGPAQQKLKRDGMSLELDPATPLDRCLWDFHAGILGNPSSRFGLQLAKDVVEALERAQALARR